ncbi:MAG: amidohydrolase family protein [Peptostreptococcaceae bacterium]|nr:amidohydrolase family protein [Peptostreptococcaceae bacterium]
MLDLLIKGGKYTDFNTGEFVSGNVGIEQGTIVSLGDEELEAIKVIDAAGKIISPGFIDIHMHEEKFKKEGENYRISEFMLKMGVTTAVGGNCGLQYQDLKEFKDVIKRKGGSPVNYIMLAGYNEFRYQLGIKRYDEATKEQRKVLRELVKRELAEGAFGVSFGIEYDPGISYEDMRDVLEVLEDERMLGAAHYRNDCINDIESVREMIKLSGEITPKFQISHLSSCSAMGWMKESLEEINMAIEKNPKLNYDTYPYTHLALC